MAADTNNKLRFHKRHPTFVRVVLLAVTFLVALGAGAIYSTWALICRGNQCPSIESLAEYTPHQTSKLYAADGRFIAELGLERGAHGVLVVDDEAEVPFRVGGAGRVARCRTCEWKRAATFGCRTSVR